MKKLVTILALVACMSVNAQTYVSGSFSYYNGGGEFSQQAMATVEVGKTINNTLSLGVAGGVTAFSGGNYYAEFRPSMILWSYKNFSVSGTLGAGYVFNSTKSFLTEYCGSMNYGISDNWSVSFFGGGYNFNGQSSASKYTFVGTGLTFTIPRNDDPSRFPGMVHSKTRR